MDDEADYPKLSSGQKKIPPFALKEAAQMDESFEKEKKKKLKELAQLGMFEENSLKLPPINDQFLKMIRVSSMVNSANISPSKPR